MLLRCRKCGGNPKYGKKQLYKVKYERLECVSCSNSTTWHDRSKYDRGHIAGHWNESNPV
jgi:hypothetical protein